MVRLVAAIASVIALALAIPAAADAGAWAVTNTTDTPVGQVCAGFTGCSLREAVTSTELNPGSDAILIQSGTYPLSNGELTVTQDLTLARVGSGVATIDAQSHSRILAVTGGSLTVRSLTLANGQATSGGAISASAPLTLDSVVLTGNQVTGSNAVGGAVDAEAALTVTDSQFVGNSATSSGTNASGGAIYAGGAASVSIGASTFSANSATAASGNAAGGAVTATIAVTDLGIGSSRMTGNTISGESAIGGALSSAAPTTINRSTFDGNTATADASAALGGGVAIRDTGAVTLTNSTIYGNVAAAASGDTIVYGGGMYVEWTGSSIVASTVTANRSEGPNVSLIHAGGLSGVFAAHPLALTGSIVSGNVQPAGETDCARLTLNSGGGNVVADSTMCGFSPLATDVAGAPDLAPLVLTGGSTPTAVAVPLLGSIALDRYPAACATADDQRGIARPQGSACDAGAVEARPAFVSVSPSRDFGAVVVGQTSADKTVAVANSGDFTSSAGAALGGTSPGQFTQSGCTGAIAPGITCIATINFVPTTTGAKSATLASADASVDLAGNGIPPAPVCSDGTSTFPYNSGGSIALTCTGTPTSRAVVDPPDHGTLGTLGTTVTYTPDADYIGPDSFTFTATNGAGTSPAATISITVDPPAAPVCTDVTVTVAYQTPGAAALACSGIFTSRSIVDPPDHGTLGAIGPIVTYTPDAGYSGPDTFTFDAVGPGTTSNQATVTITVAAPLPPAAAGTGATPECDDLVVSTAFATPATVRLRCSALVWNWGITTLPEHGTLGPIGADGRLTYTPDPGFGGDDRFRYGASGPGGSSIPAVVIVHVAAGPATVQSSSTASRVCTPYRVTIRLNPHGVHFVRARVSVDGVRVRPAHSGTRWTARFQLKGTRGQRVTVRIHGRRDDGRLLQRTRVLTVC